jgi:hypothetical protein
MGLDVVGKVKMLEQSQEDACLGDGKTRRPEEVVGEHELRRIRDPLLLILNF